MQNKPLLTKEQIETLLHAEPEMRKIEQDPNLSPKLRDVLIDLERNAADAYAAGTWHIEATKEKITVPEGYQQDGCAQALLVENTQQALGNTYLNIIQQADQNIALLKSIMQNLGLNPSMPQVSAAQKGRM